MIGIVSIRDALNRAQEQNLDLVEVSPNADPPVCFTCALNGFDATTYDVPGIYGYVRCGYQM